MAEVHFKEDVEISIPDGAFHYARRLLCNDSDNIPCDCNCHFDSEIDCKCKLKGKDGRIECPTCKGKGRIIEEKDD